MLLKLNLVKNYKSDRNRIINKIYFILPFLAADPPTMRFVNTFECPHPSCGVSNRPLIVGTAKGFVADST